MRTGYGRPTAVLFTALLAALCLAALCLAAPAFAVPLPIRVDTTSDLRTTYGYAPEYQLNIPSFDTANRPVFRTRTESQHATRSVVTLSAPDTWRYSFILAAVRRAYPRFVSTVNAGGYVGERVEFDARGRAYTLLEIRMIGGAVRNVLLYSLDGCRTWRLVELPFAGKPKLYDGRDNGTAALEQYAGWNQNVRPPLVAVWRPVSDWSGTYASRSRLYVIRPQFKGRRLLLPVPTFVSKRFIGLTHAAGGASFAVSSGRLSHIVWPEVARRADTGTPTYACTFDSRTRRISGVRPVALANPRNDDHDSPGIVRDGAGYLHVLTGSHNGPFWYVHSLEQRDTRSWTAPETVLDGGFISADGIAPGTARQTYLSLACLPDNSLVIVYRQGRRGVDTDFDGAGYDALCSQTRSPDGVWSEAQRLVLCGNRSGYANYHQKLTVDRLGRLYLSLSYFSPADYPVGERAANRYHQRMILISRDGGHEWEFARKADFTEGVQAAAGE